VSTVAPVAPASAGSAARPASTPTPAPPIRAASPALSGRAAVTELDPVWFRAHLDWFEDAPGGLRVKRRHREEFERLFAR
jgi:hypothetical protein